MMEPLLDFINYLRRQGITCSLAETIDFFNALSALERPLTIQNFKNIVKITLAKTPEQQKILDDIFSYLLIEDYNLNLPTLKDKGEDAGDLGLPSGQIGNEESLYFLLRINNEEAIKKLLGSQENWSAEIKEFLANVKRKINWYENLYKIEKEFGIDVRKLTEEELEKYLVYLYKNKNQNFKTKPLQTTLDLTEKDLLEIDPLEKAVLDGYLKKIAQNLAWKKSYRKKLARRGVFNGPNTFRLTLKTGGVPTQIVCHQYKLKPAEIILLLDISGSMADYSSFFLKFTYHIAARFQKINLFLFVDKVTDVTNLLNLPYREFIETLEKEKLSYTGFSDYRRAFLEFLQNKPKLLNRQKVLIILGDAKNNWQDSGAEYLKEIKKRVKKIFWLTPLTMEETSKTDCVIHEYKPFIDKIFLCRSLKDIEKFYRDLF
ncbi:VWA domain-containing protein [Carboxydothermus hydrogenoformans]|nr:VWA domain-containing protein [Carboxydothermus hydrogenoformans]